MSWVQLKSSDVKLSEDEKSSLNKDIEKAREEVVKKAGEELECIKKETHEAVTNAREELKCIKEESREVVEKELEESGINQAL